MINSFYNKMVIFILCKNAKKNAKPNAKIATYYHLQQKCVNFYMFTYRNMFAFEHHSSTFKQPDISCNARLFVCVCGTRNCMDWRLLVKECIAKIARIRKPNFKGMVIFLLIICQFFLDKQACIPRQKYVHLGEPAYCAQWGGHKTRDMW